MTRAFSIFIVALLMGGCTPSTVVVRDRNKGGEVQIEHAASGGSIIRVVPEQRSTSSAPPAAVGTNDVDQKIVAAQAAKKLEAIQKDVGAAQHARDKIIAETAEARRTAGLVSQQIQELHSARAAAEKDTQATVAKRDQAHQALAIANKEIADHQGQLAAVNERLAARSDALKSAAVELGQIQEATNRARSERDDVVALIGVRQRQLTELEGQIKAIEMKRRDVPATPATQSAASTVGKSTTNAMPTEATDGGNGWNPWTLGGGGLAAVILAVLGVLYGLRKTPVFVFTVLNEANKAAQRLQLMPGNDRVELGGAQPVKKSGAGRPGSPFLTVDRGGRLVLHALPGFIAKLNEKEISVTDAPIVKAGNVIEITANGQTKRLLIGPVSAVKQGENVSVKPLAASAHPA